MADICLHIALFHSVNLYFLLFYLIFVCFSIDKITKTVIIRLTQNAYYIKSH